MLNLFNLPLSCVPMKLNEQNACSNRFVTIHEATSVCLSETVAELPPFNIITGKENTAIHYPNVAES